jgi:pimeloyl-ACP methyl ester carboxylesterase
MAALLDTLNISKAVVIGVSGGGPTALQFALRHPHRSSALVMVAAITKRHLQPTRTTNSVVGRIVLAQGFGFFLDLIYASALLYIKFRPLSFAKRLLRATEIPPTGATGGSPPSAKIKSPLVSSAAPSSLLPYQGGNQGSLSEPRPSDQSRAREEAVERRPESDWFAHRLSTIRREPNQIRWMYSLSRSGYPLSARKIGLDNDLTQFAAITDYPIERITCPTLVVHGRHDGNVPFDHAEFVATRVPGAKLLVAESCGHMLWMSPDEPLIRSAVLDFAKKHSS